jgi:glutaredoxin 3
VALNEQDTSTNKVVIYSKTWCPHCQAAKKLMDESYPDVQCLVRDLDIMEDPSGPCLAKALADFTGQTSVPNIFIGGKQIGGNSDLQALHKSGSLNF